MLYLIALTLLVLITKSNKVSSSNSAPHEHNLKIVNGEPAQNSEFPWIVSLRTYGESNTGYYSDLGHFCGGSLISSTSPPVILTAAHCLDGLQDQLEQYEKQAKEQVGGKWDFELYVDIGRTVVKTTSPNMKYDSIMASNWYIHQDYDADTTQNDIAIIVLDGDINYSDAPNATTVSWDVSTTLSDGDIMRVIGYGTNSSGGGLTDQLEYTDLEYVDNITCNNYQNLFVYLNLSDPSDYNWSNPDFSVLDGWSNYQQYIYDGMICGWSADSDSCQGDSGGPLINEPLDKTSTQVGIVSWGFGCAFGVPGIYSSVNYYRDWISGAMSCIKCTEGDTSDETETLLKDSLNSCKSQYDTCKNWVKTYGQPNDRYKGHNHNEKVDVIIIVVIVLCIALVCGIIICICAYYRKRRHHDDKQFSLIESTHTDHHHEHSHSHGNDHHGHHHH